jgi:hypothetical protein
MSDTWIEKFSVRSKLMPIR